jgi:hypothetical protein
MFAIVRGANGRRHEVDFNEDPVIIDVTIGATMTGGCACHGGGERVADGFFATIRASDSLSSASAVNRPEDVVSSAASRLANIDVVFFIVIGPSPEVQFVITYSGRGEEPPDSGRLHHHSPGPQGKPIRDSTTPDSRRHGRRPWIPRWAITRLPRRKTR